MKSNGKNPTVALIFGGRGYEHGVSQNSAEYIISAIDKNRFNVLVIYISKSGEWLCAGDVFRVVSLDINVFTEPVYPALKDGVGGIFFSDRFIGIDCAVPILHGDFGEDGIVQGTLENAKIRYVGCDTVCSAVCADKAFTKSVAERLGIPVARYVSSYSGEDAQSIALRTERELDFPVFVKPSRLGSSIGASVALSHGELVLAIENALSLSPHVITEERIKVKCELECAYFGALGNEIFTDVGMIRYFSGFYDFGSKYESGSRAQATAYASVSEAVSNKIKKYSLALKRALKIRHLSRFDYFLTTGGEIIFNEVNTFPGFTESSLYPSLVKRAGICVTDMLSLFIEDAIGDRI